MRLRYRWWIMKGWIRRMYLRIRPDVYKRLIEEKRHIACHEKLNIFERKKLRAINRKLGYGMPIPRNALAYRKQCRLAAEIMTEILEERKERNANSD